MADALEHLVQAFDALVSRYDRARGLERRAWRQDAERQPSSWLATNARISGHSTPRVGLSGYATTGRDRLDSVQRSSSSACLPLRHSITARRLGRNEHRPLVRLARAARYDRVNVRTPR